MKTKLINKRAGIAMAALAASIGLSASANAILLQYEPGSGALTGQFYNGPVVFKFSNFDSSTQYTVPPAAQVGYFGAPGVGVAGGILAVNGVAQTPAINAQPGSVSPGSNEDTWGIAKMTSIQDPFGNILWSPGVKNQELTVMIYGEQDFNIRPSLLSGFDTQINGVGLRLDVYEQALPAGVFEFDATNGPTVPGARAFAVPNVTGGNYPTVSNVGGTEGPLVLQLRSTPGFLFTNAGPGVGGGGSATEYTEDFNSLSLNGQGSTYLNVIGGRDLLQFDTNLETTPAALINFGMTPARFADISGTFTVKPPPAAKPGTLPWTVSSNDPLLGNAVPEPASVLSGLACLVPILGSVFGRNRRRRNA